MELLDFPYTGERRPFDWFQEEPEIPTYAPLLLPEVEDAYGALRVTMLLYLADRKSNYLNYMRRGKLIFLTCTVPFALKDKAPHWDSEVTEWLNIRTSRAAPDLNDWPPNYEIQRLWLITGIHWSWLELCWAEAEDLIWRSGRKDLIAKLERVPPCSTY